MGVGHTRIGISCPTPFFLKKNNVQPHNQERLQTPPMPPGGKTRVGMNPAETSISIRYTY